MSKEEGARLRKGTLVHVMREGMGKFKERCTCGCGGAEVDLIHSAFGAYPGLFPFEDVVVAEEYYTRLELLVLADIDKGEEEK